MKLRFTLIFGKALNIWHWNVNSRDELAIFTSCDKMLKYIVRGSYTYKIKQTVNANAK